MTLALSGSVSISGSLDVGGSAVVLSSATSSLSASYAVNATTASYVTGQSPTSSYALTASYVVSSVTDETQNTRLTAIETVAGSYASTSSLSLTSASVAAINIRTGSYATTGSNYFIGTQVITGSVYIANDLIVQGSSSLQNITASAVSIGTNTVILNTDSPAVRFAGISVRDSGSNSSVTSSIWYDSLNNKWIYQNESGSSYSGGMFISGPRNTGSLGDEVGMTNGYIAKGLGGDHIGPSIIFESGSNIGIGTTNPNTQLQLQSSSPTIRLTNSSAGAGAGSVQFYSGSTQIWNLGTHTNNDMYLYNSVLGSYNYWIQNSTGNIGIGNTNPSVLLHLTNGTESNIRLESNGAGGDQAAIYVQKGSGNGVVFAEENRDFIWRVGAAALTGGGGTERMRLTNAGNVGIGTTSPTTRLHLYASNNAATVRLQNTAANKVWDLNPSNPDVSNTGFTIHNVTDNTKPFHIMDGGNIGIGTTSPNGKLDVAGNIYARYGAGDRMVFWYSDDYYFGITNPSSDVRALKITAQAADGTSTIQFYTGNNAERMRITSGGDIEVNGGAVRTNGGYLRLASSGGSTTGGYFLRKASWIGSGTDHSPSIAAEGGYGINFYTNGSTTERMVITSGGSVGIGTTNPLAPLHVAGDIRSTGLRLNQGTNNQGHRIYSRTMDVNSYTTNTSMRFAVTSGNAVQFQYEITFHATRTTSGNLSEIWYLKYTGGIAYNTSGNPDERWWDLREQAGNGIAGVGRSNQTGYFEIQNSAYDSGCRLTCVVAITCNNWDAVTVTFP